MTETQTITDSYFDTLKEAIQEMERRRALREDLITRLDNARYGGYVVHSIPVDLFVDELAEPHTLSKPIPRTIYG